MGKDNKKNNKRFTANKKNYIDPLISIDVNLAKISERKGLNEIDIIDKDKELINNLTWDEVETILYLRHMPEALADNNKIRIRRDYNDVTEFLIKYDYITPPWQKH